MAQVEGEADEAAAATPGYRRYVMGVLLLIYTLNFLDRQVVNILAEPIKRDLGLADWQLGALTGLSFAVLYSTLGLPIARYAERGHRPRIIAGAVLVWSAFTVLCGFAASFVQLLLARVGVGVGEAGCTPPAHSLIMDYTPRAERASAMAFYALGTPLGGLLGMALGGLVADAWGWRAAFVVAGAPGIVAAVIAATTLREPRALQPRPSRAAGPTFAEAVRELAAKRTFWLIAFGGAAQGFIVYGQTSFTAVFFFRNHAAALAGMADAAGLGPSGFLGLALGLSGALAGIAGAVLGGRLSDRFAVRDLRAFAILPAIFAAAAVPFFIAAMLSPSAIVAILLLAVPTGLTSAWFGPVYASIQGLVQPHTRATAAAVFLFVVNLIGLGLGPMALGALSDALAGPAGLGAGEGLRWALIAVSLATIFSVALFLLAARSIRRDSVS